MADLHSRRGLMAPPHLLREGIEGGLLRAGSLGPGPDCILYALAGKNMELLRLHRLQRLFGDLPGR